MGDMKTPDFDDLLAAFDIPDMDAIQSSPEEDEDEEEEEERRRRRGAAAHESGRRSPQSFPEPPAVSVIVKNTVRCEEEEEEDAREDAPTDRPSHSQVQDKLGDAASEADAKHATAAAMEPPVSNGFERAAAGGQGRSRAVPWPHHPLLLGDNDAEDGKAGEDGKAAEDGAVQNTASAMNRLTPHLFPAGPKFPAPSSPHSGNLSSTAPPPPPYSPQKEEPCLLDNPPSPPSPLSQNGGRSVTRSDEDDSELDLGSPLVIQESPEFTMPSPPKFKHRRKPLSPEADFLSHPLHALSSSEKQEAEPPALSPSSPAPRPPSPRHQLPPLTADPASVQEERCPEHVIDERDSPESPPPSEMGLVFTQRRGTPDLTPAPPPPPLSDRQEEPMDSKPSGDDEEAGEAEEQNEKTAGKGVTKPAVAAGPPKLASLQQRPLKVKIKMPKGSLARAGTGAAPKRGGKAASKPSPAESHGTRSKREQPEAVSLLQEALESSGGIKDKIAKSKVSATAVSITKTASLPSISASSVSRGGGGSPAGINLRSLGQKTLSSGTAQSVLLPSQGSGNRPASIVNSTGAIISKSQTNLVESFNKILNNKNLLPSYKPDLSSPLLAEWGLPLPAQGYRCLECGDAFALEQSLARHYDRRSLRIEVTCNHCAKRLAFFNKCSLLLHAREHKEKGLIMQCSHLVMKPVPVEQMIGQQEPTANGQTVPSPSPRQAAPGKKSDGLQYVGNKCPECQTQFGSKEEVAQHFQEIRAAHTTSCTECSPPMLLPNSCSAAAHQRVHQGAAPHVCPECGGTAKQSALQTHLDETCLHFARRIGYRCSSCLVVFGGLNSVKAHIQQAHCDMFHKCPSCPMAFKSAPSTQNHIAAQHPTLTDGQAMLIYKCVMCDTVFTQKTLLYVHFDTHLTNQKVHVFKCPECTKLFSQRNSLMDHHKSHKTPTVKQELPSPPAAPSSSSRPSASLESSEGDEWTEPDKEEKVKTERVKTPSGWKCVPCHARYTDREEFISHMAKQHNKVLKKFPCNKCESSFTTTSSLRRHIRDKHKVMNRGFRCQFCIEGKKTFSSRAMLEKHIQLRHGMDAASQDKLTGSRDDADSSSEQDGSLGGRRRRRGGVKVEPEEESLDGASPAKKQRPSSTHAAYSNPESGFRCAPCGFATEEQAAFLEHIIQHQRAGSEVQCQQCGACFTSNNSLSRHLFISHKVRDAFADHQQALAGRPGPSTVNSRNHDDAGSQGGSAPTSPSAQAAAAQGNEEEDTLACKVCGKQFDKATDLNTHFRTHGMAFISARNAGKTT